MRCDYCGSTKNVEEFRQQHPVASVDRKLCEVCSRLRGTSVWGENISDINHNIVTLFQTLGLVPHETDLEEE